MPSNRKIIILSVAGIAVLLAAGFTFFGRQQPQNVQSGIARPTSSIPELASPITRQDRIDNVMATYAAGGKYQEYTIGDESHLIVTYYQWPSRGKDWAHGGGLLVFKVTNGKPILIWENNSIHYTLPLIKTEDMTGDGKNELLALWQNGKYESLYIYEYKQGEFHLLTPYHNFIWYDGHTSTVLAFGAQDSETQIKDLDGDTIPEVWYPSEIGETGNLVPERYVAYKWDGSKYVLWKEQQEPFAAYKDFLDP